jgi:hypothetical protein
MGYELAETAEDAVGTSPKRPKVISAFSGYTPPFDPVPIVERMLDSVPQKYLIGLSEVVLSNTAGLSRRLRRRVTKARGKKVRLVEARGLYHQEWHGKPAWIQIFVDRTLLHWEGGWWLRIPFIREGRMSEVLFHEIGHHIHFTARPEHREKEDVADVWKVRLERNYYRRRFPLFRSFFRLVKFLFRPWFERQYGKLMKDQLKKGWISRAEYQERVRQKSKD